LGVVGELHHQWFLGPVGGCAMVPSTCYNADCGLHYGGLTQINRGNGG